MTPPNHALRETVESIALAVILAFLFRAFVAEAFVIPTGSMAPTLMGQHKDVQCPECGYWYQAGASIEIDDEANDQRFWKPGGCHPRARSSRQPVRCAGTDWCWTCWATPTRGRFRAIASWSANSPTILRRPNVGT